MTNINICMMAECLAVVLNKSPDTIETDMAGLLCFGSCLVNNRHAAFINEYAGVVYTDLWLKESPEIAVLEFLECKASEHFQIYNKKISPLNLALAYTVRLTTIDPVQTAIDTETEYLKRSRNA